MNDRTNGAASGNGDPRQTSQTEQDKSAAAPGSGRTRAEERIAALDASKGTLTEFLEQLKTELEAATTAAEEAEAGWQRARADFANFKRRSEEERDKQAGLASDSLLLKVVALADDFDLAIEHVPEEHRGSPWVEGIGAIDRKLRALLESEGVQPMRTEGQPFDPHTQQAISYEETTEVPDGTVLAELQRGYYVRDRVLRPALVAVARNDDDTTSSTHDTND
jgi:molecular chaperone GrpE